MEKRRILAIIMAALMVITLLPSMVFASAPSGTLGGKLKIKGDAAVGAELSADYGKAEPQGLSDDYVSFKWSRELSETELEEVGTEKKYKVTEEDLGYKLVLEVTGREDLGLTGTLKAKTPEVTSTVEEAQALVTQLIAEGQEVDMVVSEGGFEEELLGESLVEEVLEDDTQVIDNETEELPEETIPEETIPEDAGLGDAELDITVSEELDTEGEGSDDVQTEEPSDGEPDADPVWSAEAITEDMSGIVDFGTVVIGKEADAVKNVTIRNTGNQVLNFKEISPERFMVQDIKEPFYPGTEVSVWIQPREGQEPGEYRDTITYVTEEGADVIFQAQMVLTASEQPEVPTEVPTEPPVQYAISADMDAMIFGNLTEGYEQVTETQTVNVTNSGETAVTLKFPESEYFDISLITNEEESEGRPLLEKGETVTFMVQPKAGLAAGSYSETIVFGIEESADITDQMTAEVVVDAAAEEVISVDVQPNAVQFDSLKEGYEQPEPTTVTITNQGNTDIILEQPLAEYFDIGALSAAELKVGESVTFTVVPTAGMEVGSYTETIMIFQTGNSEGETEPLATVEASVTVEEKEEEPVYKLTVNPEVLNFGEREVGYTEAPESQRITIVNEGNTAITLEKPVSNYFRIGNLSQEVLEPGEECTLAIRPKNNLEESTYVETITIPNDGNVEAQVDAEFTVTIKSVEFLEIQKPADITGLKNGIDKTAEAFGLPATVVIKTTDGKMKAKVKWNVKGSAYDPSNKEAQTFKVNGKIVLPQEVGNPNNISLVTSVKVSVKAAYVPKVPDASENKITGIASEGYTTQSKISFTAVGAGMENTSPREGDVRYLPLKWKVINTNSWQDAPYSATFGITKAGTYTLKVLFERQKFDGSEWVNTGEQDTRQVGFSISQAEIVTPTPEAQQKDTGKKSAVATGDTTAILPFVIILIVAVFCIAGVVVYRKKRK